MDISVTRKMLSPNQIKLSEQIAETAIEEMILTGTVKITCPWCKEPPKVDIWGLIKRELQFAANVVLCRTWN